MRQRIHPQPNTKSGIVIPRSVIPKTCLLVKLLGIKSIARLEAAVVGVSLYEHFAEGAVVEVLIGAAGFVGDVFVVA